MKIFIFLFSFFFLTSVFADEPVGENHFHWPKSICHQEEAEKLDSAPQSPPLVVDDPETPGCNRWEINVVMSSDYSKVEKHYELPLLDINYGIGDDIELKYEVPNLMTEVDDQTRHGVGESNFGIKYKFFEEESSDTSLAFYPQYQFVTPNSNAQEKGLAENGVIIEVPLLFSRRVGINSRGDIMMSANLGFNFSTKPDVANYISGSIAIGLPVLKKVSFMAELSSQKSFAIDTIGVREELYRADIGIITTFVKHVLLLGSVGQSLYSTDNQNHTYVLAGLRVQELSSLVFW